MLVSCAGGSTIEKDTAEPDRVAGDVVADTAVRPVDVVSLTDTVGMDEVADNGADMPDFAVPDTTPACAPGEGCFGDECVENAQCQSGWCVEHMGEGLCSQLCQEECPVGWSCQQVAGTAPDIVYVCVSDHANLCKPCSSSAQCQSTGADDVCVDYGTEGAFCGGACQGEGECPWGFSCKTVLTVDEVELKQCMADAGVCPCTDSSVAKGLWTPCANENEFGACSGKRVCLAEGLSGCNAVVPAAESCNGVDDDCDGETDEPSLVAGKYVELCDDGNPCTEDSCAGEQGCVNTALEEGECSDGNPCTVADHCVAGECSGDPVQCDDENQCTDNVCTATGGCEYPAVSGSCDDGNPCTLADQCQDGTCVGTQAPCDCLDDGDCDQLEDGDLCNGTLVCDTAQMPHKCVVEAGTVVECPEPGGDNAFCLRSDCSPQTGLCAQVPANDGVLCDDGNMCTVGAHCTQGVCSGGVELNCNDGNPCTDDACDSLSGCAATDNTALCSDGDVCTVGDGCADGECLSGAPLECDDGNVCNGVESCDGQVGCQSGQSLVCDDGNACTVNACDPLQGCVVAAVKECDDLDPCTMDTCDPVTAQCQHSSQCNCPPCQACLCDADNGAVTCQPKSCDDDNACTIDLCDPLTGGCLHSAVDCSDGDVCTTNTCDPAQGCVTQLNQAPCNDENLCTVLDHCHLGECIGSGDLNCNDSNPCTDDTCLPGSGCQFVPNLSDCDDDNACTSLDVCKKGWCSGTPVVCDDSNICTDDSCDPGSGCVAVFNSIACNDNDPCTLGDACDMGVCKGTGADSCDDENPCTLDECIEGAGCQHQPQSEGQCDDNDPCTLVDVCLDGECTGTVADDCADDDVCTSDSCVPFVGCIYGANDGNGCDDKDACTVTDICQQGECVGSGVPACDDGNPCTNDACVSPGGCQWQAVVPCCGDGKTDPPEECDDGNTASNDGCDADCQTEQFVSMQWTDPQTGSCNGLIWQKMQQIANAMPGGAMTVKVEAEQVQPTPGYGYWSATFANTTCVRQWVQAIANKDVGSYNNWDPAVCQATSTDGDPFFFVCKNDGGGGRQIAVYPVGVQPAQYMKIYMIDRLGPWCDLIGTNARPGADNVHNNSNTSGVAGDYLKFTWYF